MVFVCDSALECYCGDNDRKVCGRHGIKEDLGIRNLIQPFGCQDGQMNCRPTISGGVSVSAESSDASARYALPVVAMSSLTSVFSCICWKVCGGRQKRADGLPGVTTLGDDRGAGLGYRLKNIRLSGIMEHLSGAESETNVGQLQMLLDTGRDGVLIHWPVVLAFLKLFSASLHLTVNNQKYHCSTVTNTM